MTLNDTILSKRGDTPKSQIVARGKFMKIMITLWDLAVCPIFRPTRMVDLRDKHIGARWIPKFASPLHLIHLGPSQNSRHVGWKMNWFTSACLIYLQSPRWGPTGNCQEILILDQLIPRNPEKNMENPRWFKSPIAAAWVHRVQSANTCCEGSVIELIHDTSGSQDFQE